MNSAVFSTLGVFSVRFNRISKKEAKLSFRELGFAHAVMHLKQLQEKAFDKKKNKKQTQKTEKKGLFFSQMHSISYTVSYSHFCRVSLNFDQIKDHQLRTKYLYQPALKVRK